MLVGSARREPGKEAGNWPTGNDEAGLDAEGNVSLVGDGNWNGSGMVCAALQPEAAVTNQKANASFAKVLFHPATRNISSQSLQNLPARLSDLG
jgi:hypothetical protein